MNDTSRDKEMMLNPLDWPRWPVLPIKRYVKDTHNFDDLQCALLAARETDRWRVYHENIVTVGEKVKVMGDFDTLSHTDYESVDAVLAAGWIVD